MRTFLLLFITVINASTVFAQSKWELLGEYKHSIFMYSYTLSLKDSKHYEIEESSDLGSTTTSGTWTMNDHTIRLVPKKKIIIDTQRRQTEQVLTDSKEEVVIIETPKLLMPMNRNFKLKKVK